MFVSVNGMGEAEVRSELHTVAASAMQRDRRYPVLESRVVIMLNLLLVMKPARSLIFCSRGTSVSRLACL